MLRDGFALVYANCSDYFDSAGRAQSWVITARDIIEVASTLGTGAVALGNGDDDTVAAIAFGANTAYTGLDVYTRNYLFGAENIDAVRSLVLRAVATHRDAVLAQNPTAYGDVTQALFDNQTICSPRRIASLTRAAIEAGTVEPYSPSGGLAENTTAANEQVLRDLGALLGLSGSVSTAEAGALYWLTIRSVDSDADREAIRGELSRIPAAQNPFNTDNTLKAPWDLRDRVAAHLRLLSPGARRALDEWIVAKRAAVAAAAGQPGPPARVAPPVFFPEEAPTTRVEIRVRR
ncbi:MAG: hypothetical protein PVI23_11365 [Maricaulaceae bacterium]